MPSFCVVSNCEHKYSHSDNVSFHKFPHHSKETLKKWITFADRGVDWKPSKWSAICSRHFLPSDFRDLATRKCLKRDAVPSVTMKQFNFDLLDFNRKDYELKLGDNEFISNCRLCGNLSKTVSSFSSNYETFLMIKKCFPTLNIQQNDDLPKSLCSSCSQKLNNFSDFIDNVSRIQKEFEDKFLNQQHKNLNPNKSINNDNTNDNNSNNNNSSNNVGKLLKIKQEPLVKIKQEISDTTNSNNNNNNNENGFDLLNDDYIDTGLEGADKDHLIEKKSQINAYLSASSTSLCTNPQDITNNCEIMEVISLEDAFIDIPDDDYIDNDTTNINASSRILNNDTNKLELKIPRINLKQKVILMERDHNYATKSLDASIINICNYKTEKFDENDIKLNCRNNTTETLKLNEKICTINKGNSQGIVVINERIVEPISAVNNNSPAAINTTITLPFVAIPSTSSTVNNLYQCNCNGCNMQFLSEKILEEHTTKCQNLSINANGSNHHICTICNYTFGTIHDFLKHKNMVHGTKLKKSIMKSKKKFGVHPCLDCNKLFMNKLALNNHRKYICIHRENQLYECKFCNEKIKTWISLRSHERICKRKIKTEESNLTKKYVIYKNIRKKNFVTDKMTIPNNLNSNPNNDGRYPCPKCGRSYTRRSNLYKHMKKHRPIDQWNLKCGDCERLFDRIHDLRQHLNMKECIGNDGRKLEQIFYVCIICNKEFKTIQRLETHIAIHSGKKPYVCETCGKAFPCFNNLHQHRITHTNLRRYKCELCERVFKRKGGLNQHKKSFHLKLRPYECPVCKHRYALKNDMLRCRHSNLRN